MRIDGFWLPNALGVDVDIHEERVNRNGREVVIRWPTLAAETVTKIADGLRQRQRDILSNRSIDDILNVLDRAAELWLDPSYPLRVQAVEAISALSGFSPEMVGHAIDLEQVSSRRGDMEAALTRELGDFRALDGFVPMPKGRTRAFGPGVIGGLFSANIPALPHLTVMRSFLVKAACFGRVSRGEPVYLPLYARSIASLDEDLASCLAVVHWDSARHDVEAAFTRGIDHLIAYGSDRTLSEIRSRARPGLSATWHGHRMGFAAVGRPAMSGDLADLGRSLAYDFTVFDQHACLAPQACFVETGGDKTVLQLAKAIESGMTYWLKELPARRLTTQEAAPLRSAVDMTLMREAMGEEVTVVSPPKRLQGVVVVEHPDAFQPTPLDRFVRLIPVQSTKEIFQYLQPVREFLQCAAIIGFDDPFRLELARLGTTRLCPPGATGTPSMVWAHDGNRCIADLVRWCDEETVLPGV